ncbi:MAG: histone deacetylase family protein [Thermodesulfobacteriota bacterium]|nr:histone deacetylase family protein [Thermodesulfobacteriota bacterium]
MDVVYHNDYNTVYASDPAASHGRIEAVYHVIKDHVTFVEAKPATIEDIAAVHTTFHIGNVSRLGIYDIAALAAGGAIQAATIGMEEPCFGLIRPPGHHASADSSWGFCFFNNMAIAIEKLKREGRIKKAFVLDIDLHFGDGTVNILGGTRYVTLCNPQASNPDAYLKEIEESLFSWDGDIIGVSAGFDNHEEDWGGLLKTSDYREIGRLVKKTSKAHKSGCFAILEGGYNHHVLGHNVMAFLEGMEED